MDGLIRTKRSYIHHDMGKENYPPNDYNSHRTDNKIIHNKAVDNHMQSMYRYSHSIDDRTQTKRKRKEFMLNRKRFIKNKHSLAIEQSNILTLSRRLKENMTRVTYKMIEDLSQSTQPHDMLVYDKIVHQMILNDNPSEKISRKDSLDTLNEHDTADLVSNAIEQTEIVKNSSFNTQEENEFISSWIGNSDYDTHSFSITFINDEE